MSKNERNYSSYKYFLEIPTRWRDNDVYQHVNNVVYYSFFDTVVNRYLIDKGGLDFVNGSVIGLAVETHCVFHQPITFPDVINAGLRVGKIGNSSVRYEIGLFKKEDHHCVANGYFTHVYVDRLTRRSTEIPSQLKTGIERLHTLY
jgi:acyl-CoA thioester hydrolase